jgi:hypothetical protein
LCLVSISDASFSSAIIARFNGTEFAYSFIAHEQCGLFFQHYACSKVLQHFSGSLFAISQFMP